MKSLKQLFCHHYFFDITTKPNKRADVQHWECKKCKQIVTCWGKKGTSTWTANTKLTPKLKN